MGNLRSDGFVPAVGDEDGEPLGPVPPHWKVRLVIRGGGMIFAASETKPWATFEGGVCTKLEWEPMEDSRIGDELAQDEVDLAMVSMVWIRHSAGSRRKPRDPELSEKALLTLDSKVGNVLHRDWLSTKERKPWSEAVLAAEAGVSRPVVHRAMLRLAERGMVERVGPSRGPGAGWAFTEEAVSLPGRKR